jgi:hypothetical protein
LPIADVTFAAIVPIFVGDRSFPPKIGRFYHAAGLGSCFDSFFHLGQLVLYRIPDQSTFLALAAISCRCFKSSRVATKQKPADRSAAVSACHLTKAC